MNIQKFLEDVTVIYESGKATELSYRSALQNLLESAGSDLQAINEAKRVNCGAPDLSVYRGEINVGHLEAKDINVNINPKSFKGREKQQYDRYRKALPNLIYTNCLDFRFYRQGTFVTEVSIGDPLMGIQAKPENFQTLENLLKDFAAERLQTITSAKQLAEMMAGKAALIKDVMANALRADKNSDSELMGQYRAFEEQLIKDLSLDEFADIYAETIAYGMFAARLHDTTLEDFSRSEAMDLLPKSNPFLRHLFSYIAGPDLDERIRWIIDELADIFQATDLQKLFEDFGHFTQRNDPFIHFYETFLAEYNPAKRKARGVWYTPEPVVNFIVRAVDDVLKSEFGLPMGLADTSKVAIDWDTGVTKLTTKGKEFKSGERQIVKKEVHRVQILDPAAGTGTFLAEVIKQIAPKVKDQAEGMWSTYVERDLIPRLHGFELLMASYAMCHMKIDMMLTELGYQPSGASPRLGVYLTNSLEEGEKANQSLPFAQWLSQESKAANEIKRDVPVMVILGNPPYSGISQNMGDWISNLIEDYKYIDGQHFGERKHWLHDDYVKFIRMSEHMIEKNGEGVLAFITNHGYLDNPTFRGMRWHLLKSFDKIWVLDLHGNSKKKETTPDGKPDKNVFDIQQGVAIVVAIKKRENSNKEKPLATILRGDLWGDRKEKNETLWTNSYSTITRTILNPKPNYYMFYDVDLRALSCFDKGFGVQELFLTKSTGIISARDGLAVDFTKENLIEKLNTFSGAEISDAKARELFFGKKKKRGYLPGDSRGWRLSEKRHLFRNRDNEKNVRTILYRPFDFRSILYDNDLVDWPRAEVMDTFRDGENYALLSPRMTADDFAPLIAKEIISNKTASRYDQSYFFPLYLYPEEQELDRSRRVNMDPDIRKQVEDAAEDKKHGRPDEVAIFDYIYGVLHCPAYRKTYAEFLRIDFPRVPYPPSPEAFWDVSAKGTTLRHLHLMEDAAIGAAPFKFTGNGGSVVDKVTFQDTSDDAGSVIINDGQQFEDVPRIAWEFYIGGYQPAQKWLKDRKGRTLSFEDVQHYQKIIKILSETDRIMKTIEMPL